MESIENALRYRLVLGKVQVIKVDEGSQGCKFEVSLASGVRMVIDAPLRSDVRVGDLLTLYTEVLLHAAAESTSIQ